jgi:hypothetical protein
MLCTTTTAAAPTIDYRINRESCVVLKINESKSPFVTTRSEPYSKAVGEYDGVVGEVEESLLVGRRGMRNLPIGEQREVARQEAGLDGAGVRGGAEGWRDRGGSAGVSRRGEADRYREELLRQPCDLADLRRLHRPLRQNLGIPSRRASGSSER